MRHDGLRASLDGERPQRIYADVALSEPSRRVADQDVVGVSKCLEPSGKMRGVADGRVVHPEIITNPADDHEPAVEPHPHA